MRLRTALPVVISGLTLSACAMAPMAAPQATLDNIQALRAAGIAPLKVGAFTPGPGAPTAMDRKIAVRAGVQAAPKGSYAQFLADTLAAELNGAGKLDPRSTLSVSGVVTDTHVDSTMPTATARLGAHFVLKREAVVVFEKDLDVQSSWSSSFIGAVAIPDAFNQYNGLFQKLVARLLADPDFKAAARAG